MDGSTDPRSYLDHGSSTPLDPAAREALVAALDAHGDPLRIHAEGQRARSLLEGARAHIAEAIGAQPDEIVFTSGGTESCALAIWGGTRPVREIGDRIVVSAVEHPAVSGVGHTLEADGLVLVTVPADGHGRVDLDRFAAEVRAPGTLLASLQHANHEVGTMQPVAEAAEICRAAKVLFHTDACQTVGHVPVDVGALGVDLLTLSAHKFGGPSAVGALFVRRGVAVTAYPCGDDRERRRRSGMENVPGNVATAAALAARIGELADQVGRQWALTDRLRRGLEERVPGVRLHGHPTQRVPHLVCFSIPGLDPEIVLMALDDRGIRIGGGSVCSGAAHDASPVLEAMGVPGTPGFRVGVGPGTTEAELDALVDALARLAPELARMEAASTEALGRFRPTRGGGS